MKIYYLSAFLLVTVLPAEAHFRNFRVQSSGMPYYQRPEWIEQHTFDKEIVIDIAPPKSQDDVLYLRGRLEETTEKIKIVKEKLNFPGIMSLRYRQHLEKDVRYLTAERAHIQHLLKETVSFQRGPVAMDPFRVYPLYREHYNHSYPAFRKVHP